MSAIENALTSDGLEKLKAASTAKPLLSINFFPYGIVMRHNTPRGESEKIVSPSDLARLLHNQPFTWGSGLLNPNTLYVGESAGYRLTVELRAPQRTGIWLDGSDEPVRVPMPPLILIRWLALGKPVEYQIFACKRRPSSLTRKLFAAPLPNTYSHGGICWGNIAKPKTEDLDPISLAKDWALLLGTKFNDHAVHSKSKKYTDIRKALLELDAAKAEKYPMDDLVESGMTLAKVVMSKEEKR